MSEERREVEGRTVGDWICCGGCGARFGVGLIAVKPGARVKCFRCKAWVRIELPDAAA